MTLSVIIALAAVLFMFPTIGVVGSAMHPNLIGGGPRSNIFAGDRVLVPRYDTWLRSTGALPGYARGEIIIFKEPENSPTIRSKQKRLLMVKRIIGLPNDRIRIEAGQVFVNSYPLDQTFITGSGEINIYPVDFPVIEVKDGQITGFQGLIPDTYTFGKSKSVDISNSPYA